MIIVVTAFDGAHSGIIACERNTPPEFETGAETYQHNTICLMSNHALV